MHQNKSPKCFILEYLSSSLDDIHHLINNVAHMHTQHEIDIAKMLLHPSNLHWGCPEDSLQASKEVNIPILINSNSCLQVYRLTMQLIDTHTPVHIHQCTTSCVILDTHTHYTDSLGLNSCPALCPKDNKTGARVLYDVVINKIKKTTLIAWENPYKCEHCGYWQPKNIPSDTFCGKAISVNTAGKCFKTIFQDNIFQHTHTHTHTANKQLLHPSNLHQGCPEDSLQVSKEVNILLICAFGYRLHDIVIVISREPIIIVPQCYKETSQPHVRALWRYNAGWESLASQALASQALMMMQLMMVNLMMMQNFSQVGYAFFSRWGNLIFKKFNQ